MVLHSESDEKLFRWFKEETEEVKGYPHFKKKRMKHSEKNSEAADKFPKELKWINASTFCVGDGDKGISFWNGEVDVKA